MTFARRSRALLVAVAVVVVAAVVVVVARRQAGPAGGAGQPYEISFITVAPPSMTFYPLEVAQELGLFTLNNVDATINVASEGVAGTSYLSTGKGDLAMVDADKIILAVAQGGDFQAVYSPQWLNTIGAVVPEASTIQSFSDLRGKTVGFASSENLPLFKALLSKANIPTGDVKTAVVGSSGALLVTAFQNAQIDAYVGGLADFVKISASGFPLRDITPQFYSSIDGNPFAITPETLQTKRDAVVAFLRAWAEAQYLAYTRPKIVEAIVRKRIPLEWSNVAAAQSTFQLSIKSMTLSPQTRMGDLRLGPWNTVQDLLILEGALKTKVDVANILNRSLIAEVNTFDRPKVVRIADRWAKQNM